MVVIRLNPTSDAVPFGYMIMTINRASGLPMSIIYDMDGDKIVVNIDKIATSQTPFKRFSRRDYKGYEWVDFR